MADELRIEILVDADACPVKPEIYKVAERHGVKTLLVANSGMAIPRGTEVELVIVGKGFDEADDWIAARACPAHVVVTADIPLASRCVAKGSQVISPTGKIFTESFDRQCAGDAQSDAGSARGRDGHHRAKTFFRQGPLGVSVSAGHCHQQAEARRVQRLNGSRRLQIRFAGCPCRESGRPISISL